MRSFDCMGPFRPEQFAVVGIGRGRQVRGPEVAGGMLGGGGWDHSLRTALHAMSKSQQNIFCGKHTWRQLS